MVIIKGSSLRGGKTKSCGCYQKLRTSEASTKNLIGQTIGNFTVLESIMGTKYEERHKWRCRCNLCGNEEAYIQMRDKWETIEENIQPELLRRYSKNSGENVSYSKWLEWCEDDRTTGSMLSTIASSDSSDESAKATSSA